MIVDFAELCRISRLKSKAAVRAYVEDGRLVLEQGRDDGAVDNVTLSRTEAKVLFAQFAEWAA